jgi:bis(5'-nucleosyl)-tetraphosphatase (symmetrical)
MATYAVGDLQGCLEPLHRLLDSIDFRPGADRLWFAGDLINRGPESLETLRFTKSLGESAIVVLGNHDLHLLAVASGSAKARRKDTLDEILAAPDREDLLGWLASRPLVHRELGFTMVHAGLPPEWTVDDAKRLSEEVCETVRGRNGKAFLDAMYGDLPDRWDPRLSGVERLRFITNALTRIRYCTADGRLDLSEKRPPGAQDDALMPWFCVPGRRSMGEPVIFGHWATLQVQTPLDAVHGVHHLDAGCVWGGALRAMRLEDGCYFEVSCATRSQV